MSDELAARIVAAEAEVQNWQRAVRFHEASRIQTATANANFFAAKRGLKRAIESLEDIQREAHEQAAHFEMTHIPVIRKDL